MASSDDITVSKKKLGELRVIDLKAELEKHRDKTGIKAVLIERLSQALLDEGHDINDYMFEVNEMTPVKKSPSLRKADEILTTEDEIAPPIEENGEDVEEDREEPDEHASYENHESMETENNLVSDNVDTKRHDTTASKSEQFSTTKAEGDVLRSGSHEPEMKGEARDEDSLVVQLDENQDEFDADLLESTRSHDDLMAGTKAIDGEGDTKPLAEEDKERDGETAASTDAKDSKSDDKKVSSGGKAKSTSSSSSKAPGKDGAKSVSHSRNLWVSGLSSNTRATDLKALFGKYGKVIGAKVVANARRPGSRCYGFVTMSNSEDATKCIHHLHRTEMHGRMISVEKTSNDPASKTFARKPSDRKEATRRGTDAKKTQSKREDHAKKAVSEDKATTDTPAEGTTVPSETDKTEGAAEPSKEGAEEKKGSEDKGDKELLSQEKIKAARERERLRRQQHLARENERRRIMQIRRDRMEHRNNMRRLEEAQLRLDKEKRMLRMEKEKLEREKYDYERQARLRLEQEQRDHMKFEREKRELERNMQEFKLLMEAQRNAMKRPMERDERQWDSKRPTITDRYPAAARERQRAPPVAYAGDRRVEKTRVAEAPRRKSAEGRRSAGYEGRTASREDIRGRRDGDMAARPRRDDRGGRGPARHEQWDGDRKGESSWANSSMSNVPSWAGSLGQTSSRAGLAVASALLPNPPYMSNSSGMMSGGMRDGRFSSGNLRRF